MFKESKGCTRSIAWRMASLMKQKEVAVERGRARLPIPRIHHGTPCTWSTSHVHSVTNLTKRKAVLTTIPCSEARELNWFPEHERKNAVGTPVCGLVSICDHSQLFQSVNPPHPSHHTLVIFSGFACLGSSPCPLSRLDVWRLRRGNQYQWKKGKRNKFIPSHSSIPNSSLQLIWNRYPTLGFQLACNHERKILHTTMTWYGPSDYILKCMMIDWWWQFQTITRFDDTIHRASQSRSPSKCHLWPVWQSWE